MVSPFNWQDCGFGVQLLHRTSEDMVITLAGLQALECISVPLALFDPFECTVVWMNRAFSSKFCPEKFDEWTAACKNINTGCALGVIIQSMQNTCRGGGCMDIHLPKSFILPYLMQTMPYSWTLHCHSVTYLRDDVPRKLVTLQAPAMVEPPREDLQTTETAMDRIIRLIDRTLDSVGGQDGILKDLRQRVLEGRLHEPIFSAHLDLAADMTWESSASLANDAGPAP